MASKTYGILKTISKKMHHGIGPVSVKPCLERIHVDMAATNDISIIMGIIFILPKIDQDKTYPMRYPLILFCFFHAKNSHFLNVNLGDSKVTCLSFRKRLIVSFNLRKQCNY